MAYSKRVYDAVVDMIWWFPISPNEVSVVVMIYGGRRFYGSRRELPQRRFVAKRGAYHVGQKLKVKLDLDDDHFVKVV
ncbi:MAG TPA: hypothetical protein VF597_01185 [Candidatus Saccharimonadales bacterium]|jgi:hypothetical protein